MTYASEIIIIRNCQGFFSIGSWEEQSSTTTSTTRPTRPTATTESTTTKPQHQTRPTTTTTTTTGSTVETVSEHQQTSHKPPGNRPWWSEYHTQRPEHQQQQSCKPGAYQSSKDGCQNYYYQCKNGRYRKYSCRGGLVWNKNANKCDSPRNANCNEPSELLLGSLLRVKNQRSRSQATVKFRKRRPRQSDRPLPRPNPQQSDRRRRRLRGVRRRRRRRRLRCVQRRRLRGVRPRL